jgi:hypothetical protein
LADVAYQRPEQLTPQDRPDFAYEGSELEIFEHAVNWKRYWSSYVRPQLGNSVLEVGAGIGANTPYLNHGAAEWVCLEPDQAMAAFLAAELLLAPLQKFPSRGASIASFTSTYSSTLNTITTSLPKPSSAYAPEGHWLSWFPLINGCSAPSTRRSGISGGTPQQACAL